MIVNVWTITAGFLAVVGAALAVLAGLVAIQTIRGVKGAERTRREWLEDRGHLLTLLVGVLALVRLVAWPHFYLLLESYVPDLAAYGVMCVFGVTRIEPELVRLLQWGKPVLLAGLGFWWVLGLADADATTTRPLRVRTWLTIPLALGVLVECGIELIYLLREKVGQPVTCCARFRDTEAAAISDNLSPLYGLSVQTPAVTVVAYVAGSLLVAVAATWLSRRPRPAPVAAWLLVAGVAVSLLLTHWAWVDVVAPRVLRLPYHHCTYELLTDTIALGPAAVLTIFGHVAVVMPPWLAIAGAQSPRWDGRLYRTGAIAIVSSLVIVGLHLV
ncbi:MAG: hypothetical protein HKO59_12300 [Phycisphaerales bacterium]|nr:hypothetical protein [Phycisphaerae bacterium]NNF44627.1 hypothetical protein [Phycisphaerales bacterium]NNM26744.1 hypothetical protein [Phycisphaerales bacterium]